MYNKNIENKINEVGNICFQQFNFKSFVTNENTFLKKDLDNKELFIIIKNKTNQFYKNEISYQKLIKETYETINKNQKNSGNINKVGLEYYNNLKLYLFEYRECLKSNYFRIIANTYRILKTFGINIKRDKHNSLIKYYEVYSDKIVKGESEDLANINIDPDIAKLLIINEIGQDNSNKNKSISSNIAEFHLNSRNAKWSFLINDILKRKSFFGNGPEYDRLVTVNRIKQIALRESILEKNYAINSDAANGLIYAVLSSGIFGLIFYLSIIIFFIKLCLNYLKNYKKEQPALYNFAFACLIFLIFRSILESSFSSWNLDYLLMLNCLLVLCFSKKESKN